jgi:cytochrome c oxidase assembly protein subunit 15
MADRARTVARLAWSTLAVNLIVVLWGGWVRASGSGAGCGNHWPNCNGVLIPVAPTAHTLIEFTHRASTGLAFVLVVLLLVGAFRAFPARHPARRSATLALIFICTEAAIGAGLVKFGLVASNASLMRGVSLGLHLVNTQFLLSAIGLTGWWASGDAAANTARVGSRVPAFTAAFAGLVLVGIAGAFASLGDTLFPVDSLAEGLAQDRRPAMNILIHVRVWHPVLAILVGAGVIVLAARAVQWGRTDHVRRAARAVTIAVMAQWSLGVLSLMLLVPVSLQLLHLLMADVLWLTVVWLAVAVREAQRPITTPATSRAASASNTVPAPSSR